MEEEWRNVIGGEGSYIVSSLGKIISLERKTTCFYKNGRTTTLPVHKKDMIYYIDPDGYERCHLKLDGIKKTLAVHRIVAIAFIPNPENKPLINHIDGNKSNNNIENLEWVTASENTRHAERIGLVTHTPQKSNKTNREDVVEIIRLYNSGVSRRDIQKLFKVTLTQIINITVGKSWSHITGIKFVPQKERVVNV